jgi:hypothetical protein
MARLSHVARSLPSLARLSLVARSLPSLARLSLVARSLFSLAVPLWARPVYSYVRRVFQLRDRASIYQWSYELYVLPHNSRTAERILMKFGVDVVIRSYSKRVLLNFLQLIIYCSVYR